MLSTGRSSPFPRTGGSVPHGSPARRQFQNDEVSALMRSTQLEGPPGPSSETVLTGLPSLKSGVVGAPLRSSSRMGGGHHAQIGPSQLMEAQAAARVAPARVRATPEVLLAPNTTTNTQTSSNANRPPSAAQYGRRATSSMGSGAAAATTDGGLTTFEEEIFAIGRLNKVLPERFGGDSRSPSSMGQYQQQRPSSQATTTNAAIPSLARPTPSPSMSMFNSSRLTPQPTTHSNNSSTANPWQSASYAGKKGAAVGRNAPLRSVQPSPTFGDHDLTTEVVVMNGAGATLSEADVLHYVNNSSGSGTFHGATRSGMVGSSSTGFNNTTRSSTSAAAGGSSFYQEEAPAGEEEAHPNRTATNKPIHVPYAPDIRPQLGAATAKSQQPRQPLVLRDYQMIAEACQRASRVRIEGAAYYKIGELLSRNKRDTLHKSIPYFKKYLNISRRLQDLQGECKALNVLGCTYYSLMHHSKEMGGRTAEELISTALEYHQEHSAIADAAGLFIAKTNMGLCFRALGELEKAAECYKAAMQFAVRSGDRVAEALALANLSEVGTTQGDVQTAQVCVERNLEIAAATKDSRVGCESYEQLGTLSMLRGDYAAATESYLMGLEVALSEGDVDKAAELRCKIGLVQGKMRLQEQMGLAIKKMSPQ